MTRERTASHHTEHSKSKPATDVPEREVGGLQFSKNFQVLIARHYSIGQRREYPKKPIADEGINLWTDRDHHPRLSIVAKDNANCVLKDNQVSASPFHIDLRQGLTEGTEKEVTIVPTRLFSLTLPGMLDAIETVLPICKA